jgi:hypothetical protein
MVAAGASTAVRAVARVAACVSKVAGTVRMVAICGAAISFACCEDSTVQSATSADGAVVRVVSRECGATVEFVTRVMLGYREILRMNADARTVSVRWEGDGKTLFISIPDDIASRDIFVKESSADGRVIKLRRSQSREEDTKAR